MSADKLTKAEQLEADLAALYRRLHTGMTAKEREQAWAEIIELQRKREPWVVEAMERRQGLR